MSYRFHLYKAYITFDGQHLLGPQIPQETTHKSMNFHQYKKFEFNVANCANVTLAAF